MSSTTIESASWVEPLRERLKRSPATWDRLAAIEARYDPMNVLRLNQNIPPAI